MKELIQNNRKFVAVYILWIFMHLIIFLMSEKDRLKEFWPLATGYEWEGILDLYDFSEFIGYSFGPFVLIFAYFFYTRKV